MARYFFCSLTKFAFLSTLCAICQLISAQNLDLEKQVGSSREEAYFLLVPDEASATNSAARFVNINDPSDFFSSNRLLDAYSAGNFVLVRVLSPEGSKDGEVQLLAPIYYKSEANYQNALATDGDRLSQCRSDGSAKACLYEYQEARNSIPLRDSGIEIGRIRKILPVNDRLVMTTSLGNLVVCEISGDFVRPRSDLYLALTPRANAAEFLAQDLTRIYLGRGMDVVVTGTNGQLGGVTFGSKLISFDGNSAETHATRRFFRPLTENWNDPFFPRSRSYSWEHIIEVELSPVRSGIFSHFPGLTGGQRLMLNTISLSEEN